MLRNRGERALAVAAGELHVGWGAGRPRPVPAPARRADRRRSRCPGALAPGGTVELALPTPPPVEEEDFATPYALVNLRWRPEVPGEPGELDGWMISGPLVDSGTVRSS